MHKVFGIRHHGPGSAKSLVRAFKAFQPDLILIEGPPDADKLIKYVGDSNLKPPVALLVYNEKDLRQAAYYPFADFSPEWQAMKYGKAEDIEIRFMDLPQAHHFALDQAAENVRQAELFPDASDAPNTSDATQADAAGAAEIEEQLMITRDPLAYIAKVAGYEDSERWWEVHLESQDNPEEVFDEVNALMGEVRARLTLPERRREQMREAFMRKTIRKAIREKFQRIAVVCGAYHAPVLADLKTHPAKTDNAILKGIKKIKTTSTWIPWTYERISTMSGYGAGVLSPAWYKLLHSNRKDATIRWMTKLAKLLRKEDLDASSAHVIEAVRLAETLATLRHLPLPGIAELKESAVTIFGSEAQIELIEANLIVGNQMGRVPDAMPVIPLQKDLEKRVKKVRYTKLMGNNEVTPKELDVRKDNHLAISHLLHQLHLIGIDWGKKQTVSSRTLGKFHEHWKLRWKVSFPIKIIEAGMWGNTVTTAATNFVKTKTQNAERLPDLTEIIEDALNANLPDAIPYVVQRLFDMAALTKDVTHLMESLPQLVNVWRYGNTRGTDTGAVEQVVINIIPRIFVSLPSACVHINEDAAREMASHIAATNRALSILNDDNYDADWAATLQKIANANKVHGILAGNATQILFNKNVIDTQAVAEHMSYFLSVGNDPNNAASWLEGFLDGSGLLIVHNIRLWNILDAWVNSIEMETLMNILPLLRRTFSEFSAPERQKMMHLAQQGQVQEAKSDDATSLDAERAKMVLPTLSLLLGLE